MATSINRSGNGTGNVQSTARGTVGIGIAAFVLAAVITWIVTQRK